MAKVFVSYSRKDIGFAKHLTAELQKSELDFWIDWEGIPPTVDWWREIEKGIEEADVFLFLISPDSAKSKICGQEIDTAVKNGKRIIPIVVREIEWQDTPPQLGHLNYIFFSRDDDFDTAVKKLMTAIQTDYEWAATHRRLQVKALDWERNNKDNGFLLRGMDLLDAEQDLATNTSKEPHPTDLQREYVFRSRKATDRQRRIINWISVTAAITLAALAAFGFFQANRATKQAHISHSQALVVNSQLNKESATLNLLLNIAALDLVKDLDYPNRIVPEQSLRDALDRVRGTGLRNSECPISALAFSPDGQWLATGDNQTTCLWNANDLSVEPMVQHTDNLRIPSLLFSPDGHWLVSWGCAKDDFFECSLVSNIWKTENFSEGPTFAPLPYDIVGLTPTFSPDGQWLAVGNYRTVSLVDIKNPSADPIVLAGHQEQLTAFAISPDSNWLVAGSVDGTTRLWDMKNPLEESVLLPGLKSVMNSVVFSPDNRWLASGGKDGSVYLLNMKTKSQNPIILPGAESFDKGTPSIKALTFNPNGQWLAAVDTVNHVRVWKTGNLSPSPIEFSSEESIQIQTILFSPDNKWLAASLENNTIELWDMRNPEAYQKPTMLPGSGVTFDPTGQRLVTLSDELTARFWDFRHPSSDFLFLPGNRYFAALSSNARWLAVAGEDGISLWDTNNLSLPPVILKNRIEGGMIFSPDNQWLAYGTCNMRNDPSDNIGSCFQFDIQLVNVTNLSREPIRLSDSGSREFPLAFSSDDHWVAAGSVNGSTIVRNLKNLSEEPITVHSNDGAITRVALSPDGQWLATASDTKTAQLWNLQKDTQNPIPLQDKAELLAFSPNGQWLATAYCVDDPTPPNSCSQSVMNRVNPKDLNAEAAPIQIDNDFIYHLVFSPNSEWIATAGETNSVYLWDIKNGATKPVIRPGNLGVNNVIFSPDNQWLATVGGDFTISLRKMDRLSDDPILLKGHTDLILSVIFSPDNQWLATSSADGTARRWNLNYDDLFEVACQQVGRNFARTEWGKYFPGETYPTKPEEATCPKWPLESEITSTLTP